MQLVHNIVKTVLVFFVLLFLLFLYVETGEIQAALISMEKTTVRLNDSVHDINRVNEIGKSHDTYIGFIFEKIIEIRKVMIVMLVVVLITTLYLFKIKK